MGFCEGNFEGENECGETAGLFPDFGKLMETS
jgi:hypothetical protein